MTREELARFDGRDGRPPYVAVNGKIYDFTGSPLWQAGDHQGAHQAGSDLSEALLTAPHVRALIERFPVVGELEEPLPAARPGHGRKVAVGLLLLALLAAIIFLLL